MNRSGVSSDSTHALLGVPQGSVLGPLLFLVYINGVCNLPFEPSTKLVLYADDILMYRPLSSLADFNHLQNDIDILDEWTESQCLTNQLLDRTLSTLARYGTHILRRTKILLRKSRSSPARFAASLGMLNMRTS